MIDNHTLFFDERAGARAGPLVIATIDAFLSQPE